MRSVPKPITYRSERYLNYIRRLPCLVRSCTEEAQPHHAGGILSGRGVGQKGSDYRCLPLCWTHHGELHAIGVESFSRRYGVDIHESIIFCLEGYVDALEAQGETP